MLFVLIITDLNDVMLIAFDIQSESFFYFLHDFACKSDIESKIALASKHVWKTNTLYYLTIC